MLPRRLTLLYVAALSAVALLCLLGQALVQRALSRQAHDSRLINIAGRQRMLGQRLSKAALAVQDAVEPPRSPATSTAAAASGDAAERHRALAAATAELREVLGDWTRVHRGLQARGDSVLGLPAAANSEALRELFGKLQPWHDTIVAAAEAVLFAVQEREIHPVLVRSQVSIILDNDDGFLAGMDAIVARYEFEAAARVGALQRTEWLLLFSTLLVLAAEGVLVFRPAVTRIARVLAAEETGRGALQRARDELETRVMLRTAETEEASARLRESEERFRLAIHETPLPMILHAEGGEVLLVNRAWAEISGYRHAEIPTIRAWTERACDPGRAAEISAHIARLYELDRALDEGEFEIFTADGERRTWDFSSAPLGALPDGRRLVISAAVDVTERKRGEDALRDNEAHLRLALEAGRMSVWRIDAASGSVRWSTAQRERGWTAGSFPESPERFARDVHPDDRAATLAAFEKCKADGTPFSLQYRYVRPSDGAVRWLESRGRPIYNSAGKLTLITGLSVDITARKEAEAALHAAKDEAERANVAKSEFLSRMSHELRTPLNAILGFGQLLEMSALDARQREGTGHILKAGRHLLGLIDEVLDVARIESGQLACAARPLELSAFVGETVDLLRPFADQHEVRLEFADAATGACDKCRALADPQLLKQVLLNLISNAIKYNRPGGGAQVRCAEASSGARVRIEIADTGQGIAEADLPRLFTPFERLGAEHSGIEGNGIGLALSQRLVKRMGGTIEARSTLGVGSTFVVELPAAVEKQVRNAECGIERLGSREMDGRAEGRVSREANESMRNEKAAEESSSAVASVVPHSAFRIPHSSSPTVLYIEDNVSNTQLVERVFECEPVCLLCAPDGASGLALARAERPDLVLLDLHLPDISGEEVLARLRADERTREVPVIMLSADALPSQIARLRAAGACDYLTKPLDVGRLLSAVDAALAESATLEAALDCPSFEEAPAGAQEP